MVPGARPVISLFFHYFHYGDGRRRRRHPGETKTRAAHAGSNRCFINQHYFHNSSSRCVAPLHARRPPFRNRPPSLVNETGRDERGPTLFALTVVPRAAGSVTGDQGWEGRGWSRRSADKPRRPRRKTTALRTRDQLPTGTRGELTRTTGGLEG